MREEKRSVWIAEDGTEFLNREECGRHEHILALACKIKSSMEYTYDRLEGSPTKIAHTIFDLLESMGYGTPRPIETREEFGERVNDALAKFGAYSEHAARLGSYLTEQLY
jgi:hypothetical protein